MQEPFGDRAGQHPPDRAAMARADHQRVGLRRLGQLVQALCGRARADDPRVDAVASPTTVGQHVARLVAHRLLAIRGARRIGKLVWHDRGDQQLGAGAVREQARKRQAVAGPLAAVVAGDQRRVARNRSRPRNAMSRSTLMRGHY